MEASITLKKVGKLVDGKTVLAGLTFGIERGSLVALVGDSEAGKSALLRVLVGFERQEYGSVFIQGLDTVKRRRATRRMIGYVPYEIDLDPWLTVEQNIAFMAALYGVNQDTCATRLHHYGRELNLTEYLPVMVSNLSPGVLKKALLARALIHDPEILILNEPTAFMDTSSRRQTWNVLLGLKGTKTIFYVSQSLPEVEQANDRILVLHEGRIILDGNLDKLLESSFQFHQFQIEFEDLSEELYKNLAVRPQVVNPSRIGNIFHFYGRNRRVFIDVLLQASEALIKDLEIHKLGLKDLLEMRSASEGWREDTSRETP